MLTVIPIGAKVTIDGGIPATVSGVMIEQAGVVSYRCIWWDGNQRREGWLRSFEVEDNQAERLKIGFSG